MEAGFQHRFSRISFLNSPNSSSTSFFVSTDDPIKIVPEFSTGNTIAGVSDVAVWIGLSGVAGSSRMSVSSVDYQTGAVVVSVAPVTGSSLTIDYASSPLSHLDIENVRLQAESIINQRLSLCYDLPVSPTPSVLSSMASRLGAALLLIRDYGVGARSTSKDGYMLYEQLMGKQQYPYAETGMGILDVGEIGMLCRPGYQLVDDDGTIITRNDEDNIESSESYVSGGRVSGRLHNITDENMRYKEPQVDADSNQAGSGYDGVVKQQG
jgi:hypothetical protein